MKLIVMYSLLALGGLYPATRRGLQPAAPRIDPAQCAQVAEGSHDTLALTCADASALHAEQWLTKLFGSGTEPVAMAVQPRELEQAASVSMQDKPPTWIACGTSLSFVSPPVTGFGGDGTAAEALSHAATDVMNTMLDASGAKCTPCWAPNSCGPILTTLPAGWTIIALYEVKGSGWYAAVRYTGTFAVFCTPCPSAPV